MQLNDPAFKVVGVNLTTGEITVVIKKGIAGATANQLKNTSPRRKGSGIIRKLGYTLAECGDILYGTKSVGETEVDPGIVTGNVGSEAIFSD
jgi:hypothetical protein